MIAAKLIKVIVALAVTVASPSLLGQASQTVHISIAPSPSTVHLGEEVTLSVTLSNVSSQPLHLFTPSIAGGEIEGAVDISLQNAAGERVDRTDGRFVTDSAGKVIQLRKRYVSRKGMVIPPGESYSDQTILTKIFDLKRPGRYTVWVTARLREYGSSGEETQVEAESPKVTFDITN
jgi:hypothetical protein